MRDNTYTAQWASMYKVTLTAASAEKDYDGTELTDDSVTASGLPDNFTVEASASGSQTQAGSSSNTVNDDYVIRDENGNNINDYCIVTLEEGTLTVNKADVTVKIKGNSAEAVYDGNEHSVSGYTVTEISNEMYSPYDFTFSGSAAAAITDAGTQKMGLNAEQFANSNENYDKVTFEVEDGSISVKPKEVTVAVDNKIKSYGEDDPGFTASVTGLIGDDTVEYSLKRETGENAGVYAIEASGAEAQGNYNVTFIPGALSIFKSKLQMNAVTYSGEYDGEAHNGGVSLSVTNGTEVTYSVDGGKTWTEEAPSITDKGMVEYLAKAVNPNYEEITVPGYLQILPKQVTVSAVDAHKMYGTDDPEALTADVVGVAGNDDIEYSVAREPGEDVKEGGYAIMPSGEAEQGNYTVSYEPGVFTIDPVDGVVVAITGNSTAGVYNGHVYSASGFKAEYSTPLYMRGDFEYNGQAEVSGTDVTEEALPMGLESSQFENKNPNFTNVEFRVTDGYLEITPATATVTVTGHSSADKYNGKAHSVSGYDVEINGELYKESDFEFSGKAEASRTDAGRTDMGLTAEQFTNKNSNFANVTFDVTDGYQTVIAADEVVVTVKGHHDTSDYDGEEHSVSGYDIEISDPLYTENDFEFTGEAKASAVHAGKAQMGLAPEQFANKNSNFSKVTFDVTDGFQTIVPVSALVTIKGNKDSVAYDGKEHSVSGYEASFSTPLYGTDDFEFSGNSDASITDAGTTQMGLAAEQFSNKNTDFEPVTFSVTDGSVTVLPAPIELTAASEEREYTGTALVNSGYSITEGSFPEGEGVASATVEGSITLTGETENVITEYELSEGTKAENYTITLKPGVLRVKDRTKKYEIVMEPVSDTLMYDGAEHSVSGFKTSVFNIAGEEFTVSGLTAEAHGTNAGTYDVNVTGSAVVTDSQGNDVSSQFHVGCAGGALTILKRRVVLTSDSATDVYTGNPLTAQNVTAGGDGFADGEGASYEFTGTQTTVGFSPNSFTYSMNEGTDPDNYIVDVREGTLSITNRDAKYAITVEANSKDFMYDGTEKTVSGLRSTEFMVGGNVFTVSGLKASGTGIHAGEYPVNVTGEAVVTDKSGNDVTEQFRVEATPGKIRIGKRNVLLRSASESRMYDGNALTNGNVGIENDGFAPDEGADYAVSGRITVPGACENTFSYKLKDNTLAADYDITMVNGTLSVTARPEDTRFEITVKSPSERVLYDGKEHSAGGIVDQLSGETVAEGPFKVAVNGNEYTVSGLSAGCAATAAGNYPVSITGIPVVTDAAGNDVTDQFMIGYSAGELTIDKRSVTLTSASDTKAYNGKPLIRNDIEISGDGFADNEGAEFNVTGSRTLVGISPNTFTYVLKEGTNADNYDIVTETGVLTVTGRDAKIMLTVTPVSGEFLYDGDVKSVEGFESLTAVIDDVRYEISGITAEAEATDAGVYSVKVSGTPVVTDAEGNDVSDQFTVTSESGTLTINPRKVILRSEDVTAEYTGDLVTGGEVLVEGDGFTGTDGVDIVADSGRTHVGVSDNAFSWSFKDGTNPGNYLVETIFGLISVTNREAKYQIQMTVNSDEVVYDGEEHTVSGFAENEFTIDGKTYTVSGVDSSASGTEVGTYGTEVSGSAIVTDAEGVDVTDQFAVSYTSGALTITAPEAADTQAGQTESGAGESGSAESGQQNDGSGTGDIGENTVPYASAPAGYWALINLIMTVVTVILGLFNVLRKIFGKNNNDEEEQESEESESAVEYRMPAILASLAAAAVSVIAFFMTEDMSRTMAYTDGYTILMAVIMLAGLASTVFVKKRDDEENGK